MMTDASWETIQADWGMRVSFETMHGPADDARVDDWELKASRRALANLRGLLFRAPMFDLLKDQLAEAERLHRKYLAESNGEFSATHVQLKATSMSTAELVGGIMAVLQGAAGTEEDRRKMAITMAFPMHPEHYAVPAFAGVVETMGGLPTLTRVMRDENPPDFVRAQMDESYPIRVTGKGQLEDGTPHCFVLQQFKDVAGGMEASLRVWYPAACPAVYLEEHAEHFAVETRNMLRILAARRNQ